MKHISIAQLGQKPDQSAYITDIAKIISCCHMVLNEIFKFQQFVSGKFM